jgi:hypothetical protein
MADPQMVIVANQLAQGDSTKVLSVDAMQFLRAALDAITPPKARETMAAIGMNKGFAWVLPPPPETEVRKPTPAPAGQSAQQADRPADAPSLFKH